MSSSLEQTIDRLATKDVCQHINYQYNHWIFFYIFVGITDAVFLFQKIKEHFVLLRVAYLLLIANVIRHYLVAQGFLSAQSTKLSCKGSEKIAYTQIF